MTAAKSRKSDHESRIFIAHSPADLPFARKIASLLKSSIGARVSTADDRNAFEQWSDAHREDIAQTDVFIGLFTPSLDQWRSFLPEIGAAWASEKPILPVVRRRAVVDSIPIEIDPSNVIEMIEQDLDDRATRELFVRQVEASLGVAAR